MKTKLNLSEVSRKQQKYRKNITKNALKTLVGMAILGTYINYLHGKKVQEAIDKNTLATLVDRQRGNLYLNMDEDPHTIELVITTSGSRLYFASTNGTVKSVAEWKKMAKNPRRIYYSKCRND